MRDPVVWLRVAWRELWPAALITTGGGLLVLAGALVVSRLGSGALVSPDDAVADLPMQVAALWGGVQAGGRFEDRVFWLARPVARTRPALMRMGVLLLAILVSGSVCDLLASALEVGRALPSLHVVLGTLYAVLCGSIAVSLLPERAPAIGLGLVLSILCCPLMVTLVLWSLETPYPEAIQAFQARGYMREAMALAVVTLSPPPLLYWSRWAPLRTARAQWALASSLGVGLAVLGIALRLLVSVTLES